MKTIEEMAEEFAKAKATQADFVDVLKCAALINEGFLAGAKAAQENGSLVFDKAAAIEQAKHEDSDGYFGFLSGAEWQHSQMQGVITLLKAQHHQTVAHYEEQIVELKEDIRLDRVKPDDYREMAALMAAKDAQLEAQKNIAADYRDRIRELEAAEVAKEKRIAELEEALKGAVEVMETLQGIQPMSIVNKYDAAKKALSGKGEK